MSKRFERKLEKHLPKFLPKILKELMDKKMIIIHSRKSMAGHDIFQLTIKPPMRTTIRKMK